MFVQNTVKIVGCQHLKICKVNVRNTKVFLSRTRQASRGDWLQIIGILSLAMMEDIYLSGSELWCWVHAFDKSQPQGQLYIYEQLGRFFYLIPSYPNLNSFHETQCTVGRTAFYICSEAVFDVNQEIWLSIASDCEHIKLEAVTAEKYWSCWSWPIKLEIVQSLWRGLQFLVMYFCRNAELKLHWDTWLRVKARGSGIYFRIYESLVLPSECFALFILWWNYE